MTSDIRALSHSEHELFEITSPSSGAARKHYRDDNIHLISSSTPPSVTAQASEMVAEFAISNSNYDMYPPGHALYEWAQQQLGRSNRLDEPQLKRESHGRPTFEIFSADKGWCSKLTTAATTTHLAVPRRLFTQRGRLQLPPRQQPAPCPPRQSRRNSRACSPMQCELHPPMPPSHALAPLWLVAVQLHRLCASSRNSLHHHKSHPRQSLSAPPDQRHHHGARERREKHRTN